MNALRLSLHESCGYALHHPVPGDGVDDGVGLLGLRVVCLVPLVLQAGSNGREEGDTLDELQGLGPEASVMLNGEGHELRVLVEWALVVLLLAPFSIGGAPSGQGITGGMLRDCDVYGQRAISGAPKACGVDIRDPNVKAVSCLPEVRALLALDAGDLGVVQTGSQGGADPVVSFRGQ